MIKENFFAAAEIQAATQDQQRAIQQGVESYAVFAKAVDQDAPFLSQKNGEVCYFPSIQHASVVLGSD